MENSLITTRAISRAFILSWIFAVLWVKEYLWWLFSIAILVYLWHEATFIIASLREIDVSKAATSSAPNADDGGPDVWREPKPPRSSTRSKKS